LTPIPMAMRPFLRACTGRPGKTVFQLWNTLGGDWEDLTREALSEPY